MTSSQPVFHGTNFEFERFDNKMLGVSCENPTTLMGFWFANVLTGAWRWANKASESGRTASNPSVVIADISGLKLKDLAPKKFAYYLRTARGETIHRHLGKWKQAGFDGLHVKLVDEEWFCVFDAGMIKVIGRDRTPPAAPLIVPVEAKDLPPPKMLVIPRLPVIPKVSSDPEP